MAAVEHVAETRNISIHAAKKRLNVGRIDVRKPASPGKSLVKTPAYKAWSGIKHGYTNPKAKGFIEGLQLTPEWQNFECFLADVGQPPKQGMCFARIDKSQGFTPQNARWMTKSDASRLNAAHMKAQGTLVGRRGKAS